MIEGRYMDILTRGGEEEQRREVHLKKKTEVKCTSMLPLLTMRNLYFLF
jgi:hypothetical protein